MYERSNGFTLIETSLVILLVGLLLLFSVFAWIGLKEAVNLLYVKSIINSGKNCLIQTILTNEKYMNWTSGDGCKNDKYAKEVENCLCGLNDPWGGKIRFLEGVDGNGVGLHGKAVFDDPVKSVSAVNAGAVSRIWDKNGKEIKGVVFILISFGKDGLADNPSYGSVLGGSKLFATLDPANPPKFDNNRDDVHLVVTMQEIKAILE